HIEEAAAVLSQYCDLLAIRAFPKLDSRDEDYREPIMSSFTQFAQVPIVNLESATRHPLQGLADMLTIEEHKPKNRPKIVLTWAPHPKALPHSVANSFVSWCKAMNHDITIVNPPGGDLSEAICAGVNVVHNQEEAFAGADFIYAKNWSSYTDYGQRILPEEDWTVTAQKMALTNQAKFMHCLPVRRNVVVSADVLQSDQSLVIKQANNRTHAAYAIFRALLDG
ncbi:MAG: acetylornithine carbamoyltransferase, partial [Saprospiraceae bacterium]|nr:acetylornithine carbamoyltransferase [Saprospiraceae bacterium]